MATAKTPKAAAAVPGTPATAPKPKTAPVRVRATQMGYYDHARRREGDVFTIEGGADFSAEWMEVVPEDTPAKVTTAPQALQRMQEEAWQAKASQGTSGTDREVL